MGVSRSLVLCTALAATVSACGTFKDISDTKKEVQASNKNMTKMLGQMDQSIHEVQTSNQNMQKLISQGDELQKKMTKLVDQGEAVGKKLDESVVGVKETLKKMDEMTVLSKTLVGQGEKLSGMIGESLAEVKLTREATQGMLAMVHKQGQSVLRETMAELVAIVRDFDEENHYRIASAKLIYNFLIEMKLETSWYNTFVAANFEMCGMNEKNPYGTLCKDPYYTKVPVIDNPHQRGAETGKLERSVKEVLHKLAEKVKYEAPLQPLPTNVIWYVALRPDFVPLLHQNLIADKKNAQRSKSIEFLNFARERLLVSLQGMAKEELEGELLSTDKLAVYLQRKTVIEAISKLSAFANPTISEQLVATTEAMVSAIRRRSQELSEEDVKLVQAIQGSAGNAKVASK